MNEPTVFIDEGPIHEHTFDTESGVSVFKTFDPDICRKSPDGKHNWDGPVIETYDGHSSTCSHCGLDFASWGMRCLP